MTGDWGWWGPWYPPSRPKDVKGGIASRSRRGDIGETWWSKRWVGALEALGQSNRLERGRSYARRGQVVSLKVSRGRVTAKVQGSMDEPYEVEISLRQLTDDEWDAVVRALASKAAFAAKLLAGEMPHDVDEAFSAAGACLFPGPRKDLRTDCSCPDSANPCKHIAAVHYIVAEDLDRDPFLLFRLRGREREEVLDALRRARAGGAGGREEGEAREEAAEPVPLDGSFWGRPEALGPPPPVAAPRAELGLIRGLGEPPFWRSRAEFMPYMERCYREASRRALALALEDAEGAGEGGGGTGEAEAPTLSPGMAEDAMAPLPRGRAGASAEAGSGGGGHGPARSGRAGGGGRRGRPPAVAGKRATHMRKEGRR